MLMALRADSSNNSIKAALLAAGQPPAHPFTLPYPHPLPAAVPLPSHLHPKIPVRDSRRGLFQPDLWGEGEAWRLPRQRPLCNPTPLRSPSPLHFGVPASALRDVMGAGKEEE